MSDYIKYMYREYLEGRTRIKKVNEDQPLFPNTGAGLLIQKNKLTDDWTALNVSDGHYEEESFNHEALAAAFLQGANMGQLRMLNEILDRARLNGPYCLENVADALLSFAPACKAESLMENPMLHFIELSKSFSKNGGIYDPVHGIYIDSKVNGLGDVPHFTLYDVSVADIEECMAWGIKHLDEVPGQIHVVNGSPPTSRQSTLRVQMTVESMTLSSHFAKTVAGAMSRNSMRKRSPVSMKSLQWRTASKRVS